MEYIGLLEQYKKKANELKTLKRNSSHFKKWRYETEDILIEIFGVNSPTVERFKKIRYSLSIASSLTLDSEFQQAYVKGLEHSQALLDSAISKLQRDRVEKPVKQEVPEEIISRFPKSIQHILNEMNGCYSNGFFAACSVMCRKALEAGIHIKFSMEGDEDKLKNTDDQFFNLRKKVEIAKKEKYISNILARNVNKIRWFGDSGAHSYKVSLIKDDVEPNIKLIRLVLEELFYRDE